MSAAAERERGLSLRVLLVGPVPPPHGGISVHVAAAHRLLARAGAECRVLDTGSGSRSGSARRGRLLRLAALVAGIRRHARAGFTVHVHTNGHNRNSWLLALLCGSAAAGAPRLLTLHSGMVDRYLTDAGRSGRAMARFALRRYRRILCVNDQVSAALRGLGLQERRLEVAAAYLPAPPPEVELSVELERQLGAHRPLLVTALAFRPEYGFEVLVEALQRLRRRHPGLGCVVLGGGEGEARARRELAEQHVGSWLHLAGDVDHPICLAVISRADVFVRATLADGDAVSVREAVALGVPVVASDVGHRPPEARLFPAGDAAALARLVAEVWAAGGDGAATVATRAGGSDDRARTPGTLLDTYRAVSAPSARRAPAASRYASDGALHAHEGVR